VLCQLPSISQAQATCFVKLAKQKGLSWIWSIGAAAASTSSAPARAALLALLFVHQLQAPVPAACQSKNMITDI
jgi:hypothetical protein